MPILHMRLFINIFLIICLFSSLAQAQSIEKKRDSLLQLKPPYLEHANGMMSRHRVYELREENYSRTVLALKTNLLYDAMTAINIEVEVPLSPRISISGEYIGPWWQSERVNLTMQVTTGNIGINYWLGKRTYENMLSGWSIGLMGGGGAYDIQLWDKKGYQGHLYNVGVRGGYSHKIGRSLMLSYSLAFGYMQSDYKEYTKVRDTKFGNIKVLDYPYATKRKKWIGPLEAKVSLVWLIFRKEKGLLVWQRKY